MLEIYFQILMICALVAFGLALLLLSLSLISFTRTGPKIREEIQKYYTAYSVYAVGRLTLYAFVLFLWMALLGNIPLLSSYLTNGADFNAIHVIFASLLGIGAITALQFCKHLLLIPSSIMMSSNYSMNKFGWLNRHLTISRLRWMELSLIIILVYSTFHAYAGLSQSGQFSQALILLSGVGLLALPYLLTHALPFGNPVSANKAPATSQRPNILMIGSDTMRADRIGRKRKNVSITPFIDSLRLKGAYFTNCYTPVARTAPSIVSMFTGTWPSTHGIRTNYNNDAQAKLKVRPIGEIFREHDYQTATISDWAGSDLKKFTLGFDRVDTPDDQWNIKFLIRQGPKDIRLFLSLFSHNRLGKRFLPELYFLAGRPLTRELGRNARSWISDFSKSGKPFLFNVFMSTTHPPFGSEYPYYTYFTDENYRGESKFGMARLTDPFEIIKSQKEPKEAFDLDQIMDLYDGSVRNFDDEVRQLVQHLETCGVADNTIIVLYSDHGMEFFENDTWGQGNSIYGPASNAIPLIIIDPRQSTGVQVDQPVRSIDVAPTLLDLCNISSQTAFDGVSLKSCLFKQSVPDLPVYCETGLWLTKPPGQHPRHLSYPDILDLLEVPDLDTGTLAIKPEYAEQVEAARDRMVQSGQWRLIRLALTTGGHYELYNVIDDPECGQDIASGHPEIVAQLKTKMEAIDSGYSDDSVSHEASTRVAR